MNLAALVRILTEKGLSPQHIADVVEAVEMLSAPVKVPKLKARARFVPEQWHPTESHYLKATALGISDDQFTDALSSFREWEFKDPKTNFDLAFHRWLRTAAKNGTAAARGDLFAGKHERQLSEFKIGLMGFVDRGRR